MHTAQKSLLHSSLAPGRVGSNKPLVALLVVSSKSMCAEVAGFHSVPSPSWLETVALLLGKPALQLHLARQATWAHPYLFTLFEGNKQSVSGEEQAFAIPHGLEQASSKLALQMF